MKVYVDKLPECCALCPCCEYDDFSTSYPYWCQVVHNSITEDDALKGRRKDCSLKEIVQCKDCKWWYKRLEPLEPYCALWSRLDTELPKENDVCSWAERKEGVNDSD